jgi:putative ABC transport system ATP-binding protein
MIKTSELSKIFRTDEIETTALNKINLEIDRGEFVAVMGPSGCGKSTLLNILGLLDVPTSGDFYFLGENVAGYNEKQRARIRKKNIGFIFQNFNLIDQLPVFENVEMPLIYLGMNSSERKRRVEIALEQMQISHRLKHYPNQLSGGQQQRVAVARAIVSKPQFILADEPTGNLDSANGSEVMNILANLHSNGATIIMVTHSIADAEHAQRVVTLFDGKMLAEKYQKLSA